MKRHSSTQNLPTFELHEVIGHHGHMAWEIHCDGNHLHSFTCQSEADVVYEELLEEKEGPEETPSYRLEEAA